MLSGGIYVTFWNNYDLKYYFYIFNKPPLKDVVCQMYSLGVIQLLLILTWYHITPYVLQYCKIFQENMMQLDVMGYDVRLCKLLTICNGYIFYAYNDANMYIYMKLFIPFRIRLQHQMPEWNDYFQFEYKLGLVKRIQQWWPTWM